MIHVVIGPTASNKSKYAINLAQKLNAQIINVDAYSIYKELDIVSAKITKPEMKGVKHHFVSKYELNQKVDIALFQHEVREKISQLEKENINIILVGGSNLYMQAILFCYEISNTISYDYTKYDNKTLEEIIEKIKKIDPEYLKKAQNNKQRIIKAILYFENTGLKYSQKKDKSNILYYPNVKFHYLQFPREILYSRINLRVQKMFDLGLKKEFLKLSSKYDKNLQAFKAIGFKEFIEFDFESEQYIKAKIAQNTRRFAKRQISWINNKILNNPNLDIIIVKMES